MSEKIKCRLCKKNYHDSKYNLCFECNKKTQAEAKELITNNLCRCIDCNRILDKKKCNLNDVGYYQFMNDPLGVCHFCEKKQNNDKATDEEHNEQIAQELLNQLNFLTCAICSKRVPRINHVQRYCKDCALIKDKIGRVTWNKTAHQKRKSSKKKELNKRDMNKIINDCNKYLLDSKIRSNKLNYDFKKIVAEHDKIMYKKNISNNFNTENFIISFD